MRKVKRSKEIIEKYTRKYGALGEYEGMIRMKDITRYEIARGKRKRMDERNNQRKKDEGETKQGTKFPKLAIRKIFLLFYLIDPLTLVRFSFLQLYLTQYVVHASI